MILSTCSVFLTGAAGFVGSHLARILVDAGCETHVLIHPQDSTDGIKDIISKIDVVEGDVVRSESWEPAIRKIRPEVCIHLAWVTTPGIYLQSPENLNLVAGTLRMANVLASVQCRRFVAAGTCFEYDTTAGILDEKSRTDPQTLYASCKLALYTIFQQWNIAHSMQIAWPRLFYLYGPFEHEKRLVPALIRSHLRNEPVSLTSPDKVRDYLHVEDVARAVWAVTQSDLTGAVNIGSGQPITIRQITEIVSRLTGCTNLARFNSRTDEPADPQEIIADNHLLMQTGWRPKYNLSEGIGQTIDWWKLRKI